MDREDFAAGLRDSVSRGRVFWRQHALARMLERGIGRGEVLATVTSGQVIEFYGDDHPFPSGLLHGDSPQALHVVAAWDSETEACFIITAYRPDSEHFQNDMKTRKK